ncbi:MAG: hypothetical protein EA361_00945 [Bacteroidetes bacterium]|nr:MAG: hypothetical protein EA361_00945 [Bacteroidota bacterium]
MENEDKKLMISMRRAAILSGTGMGLLLGLIIGLSVSEVVKVIMGSLTVLLGAFLGFDRRNFSGMDKETYTKDKNETLLTSLRAGWFGLAVVAGILVGMWIRAQEVFTISIEKRVEQYTNAGYDTSYALKLVAYERLGINPQTGEAGEITTLQRSHQSNLFSAEDIQSLCSNIDPDLWNNDWERAKQAMQELGVSSLTALATVAENNIPENERFEFLAALRFMVCMMQRQETAICKLGTDIDKWRDFNVTRPLAEEVEKLPNVNQRNMMNALSKLVCQLEND